MIALWPLALRCGYCNLFGPVHFKDIQCNSRSLQKGMHAPIETRSGWLPFLKWPRFNLIHVRVEYTAKSIAVLLSMDSPSAVSRPWQPQSWATDFVLIIKSNWHFIFMKILKRTLLKNSGKIHSNVSCFCFALFVMFWKETKDNDQINRGNPDCLNVWNTL